MSSDPELQILMRESSIPFIVLGMVGGFFLHPALTLVTSLLVIVLLQLPPLKRLATRTLPPFAKKGLVISLLIWMGALAVQVLLTIGEVVFRFLGTRPEGTTRVWLLAWVLAVGWLAHQFKHRHQYLYGVTEIAFGLVCAFKVTQGINPNELRLVQWTAVMASAYIVARGLGNCKEAKSRVTVAG